MTPDNAKPGPIEIDPVTCPFCGGNCYFEPVEGDPLVDVLTCADCGRVPEYSNPYKSE